MYFKSLMKYVLTATFVLISFCMFSQNNNEVAITRDLEKPPFLKKGDTIIILSPAGKVSKRSSVDDGIELANHWGLVVFFGNHLLSQDNTFAGKDEERLQDLQKAIDDPSIKAIWCSQ